MNEFIMYFIIFSVYMGLVSQAAEFGLISQKFSQWHFWLACEW